MRPLDLANFLQIWANQVINTEQSQNIPIIFENQGAPRPVPPYVVIGSPFGIAIQGAASKGDVRDDGTRDLIQDLEATVSMMEIGAYANSGIPNGGDGRFLQDLSLSIEREDIKELFRDNGIAYRQEIDMDPLPQEREGIWDLVQVMDIRFGFAARVIETTSWIETIEYNPNYEGGQE